MSNKRTNPLYSQSFKEYFLKTDLDRYERAMDVALELLEEHRRFFRKFEEPELFNSCNKKMLKIHNIICGDE